MAFTALTNYLNVFVRDTILEGLHDQWSLGTPLWDVLWKNRENDDEAGINLTWAINHASNDLGQTLAPFEQFKVTPPTNRMRVGVEYVDKVFPVLLSKSEIDRLEGRSGRSAINQYVKTEVAACLNDATQKMAVELFGNGANYNHPKFQGVIETPIHGLRQIIAENRIYAGLDSTTNTFWNSYVKTIAPASIADMYDPSDDDFLPSAMSEVTSEVSIDSRYPVNLIVTTPIMYQALKEAGFRSGVMEMPVTRSNKDAYQGKMSFQSIEWEGIPVIKDHNCPGGHMFFINTDTLYLSCLPSRDLKFEDFGENTAGDGIVANFTLSCQIICTEPRRQGVITGGTASRA